MVTITCESFDPVKNIKVWDNCGGITEVVVNIWCAEWNNSKLRFCNYNLYCSYSAIRNQTFDYKLRYYLGIYKLNRW